MTVVEERCIGSHATQTAGGSQWVKLPVQEILSPIPHLPCFWRRLRSLEGIVSQVDTSHILGVCKMGYFWKAEVEIDHVVVMQSYSRMECA